MCGIFGYVGKSENAGEIVLGGLKKLEYRGYDSWGIACFNGNRIEVKKEVGKIGGARISFSKSNLGLGQTRWATHGGVTRDNAHPHLDCTNSVAVVHNGIVENYLELKKSLRKKHKFKSQTDTEVISHLIEELLLDGNSFLDSVRLVFLRLKGLNAFVALDAKNSVLAAVKNGSPLVGGVGNGESFVASDSLGIADHVRNQFFIEDNELALFNKNNVLLYDCESGHEKKLNIQEVSWNIKEETLGHYKHFLIKEINEQPLVISNIIRLRGNDVSYLANLIRESFGTYLVGCGTASYVCLAGTYFFNSVAHHHVNFSVGSEFNYLEDFITPKSLVIGISQSGETVDIIEPLTRAKRKGAKIASVVNVIGSSLYRLSDFKLLIGAGQERAVLSTKACSGQLAILLYTAYALSGEQAEGRELLEKTLKSLKYVLSSKSQNEIRKVAKMVHRREHIYVVGRGVSFAAALEIALKVKEASYIHCEGFAAGELKHGVIALIEKGTPCIVVAPGDETYGASIAGAMELRARGAHIIGISDKNNEVFDSFVKVPFCGIGSVIPNIVVGQLLAYELSLIRKTDPDKPRNLAKSVTVK